MTVTRIGGWGEDQYVERYIKSSKIPSFQQQQKIRHANKYKTIMHTIEKKIRQRNCL